MLDYCSKLELYLQVSPASTTYPVSSLDKNRFVHVLRMWYRIQTETSVPSMMCRETILATYPEMDRMVVSRCLMTALKAKLLKFDLDIPGWFVLPDE